MDPEAYENDSIIKESKMISEQVDPYTPSFVSIFLQRNELEDETTFIQFGRVNLQEYFDIIKDEPGTSSWNDDLIKNPDGRYKFVSMELNYS